MPKRGASGLSLLLGVDKPVGMSSHDVVNRVRSATGEMRVGHFGTLDPLASGVMLVGVGPAVRLGNYLVEHDKEYVADIRFGEERTTDDAEGE
ncbi:MAG: tRNA pseudouridine(55) synthase TruB, partial [Eggerthellaceae bacterium]|nr:tRNA pseudouridine(55) synthase TruB [Eggerthellaceae bacterium]